MALTFGYNTNGFAHHRLEDAVDILAELGYGAVGITLDYGRLDPFDSNLSRSVADLDRKLRRHGMRAAIETGARFLLDPRRKHQPTLLSTDESARRRRSNFIHMAINVAADINADVVSLWSGRPEPDDAIPTQWRRLEAELAGLLPEAERCGVPLALEPEPGMLVDTIESTTDLFRNLRHPFLQLTVDVGHVHCQVEGSIAQLLEQWRPVLANVHIEDMKAGIHDHLMFGEGEIDFPPVLRALERIDYRNGVYVELSRHSHDAVVAAQRALEFLKSAARGEP